MENIWDNTTVLIVSDHGFGGVSDKAVSINKWLEQQGFLSLGKKSSSANKTFNMLRTLGLKYLPHGLQEKVFRTPLKLIAQHMESASRFYGIQWNETMAFSEDINCFPSIYINLRGREPEGTVPDLGEYNRLRDDIIVRILNWKDPSTKQPVIKHAWRREEIYSGDHVRLAPDIMLELNTDNGYSYMCLPHRYFKLDETVIKLSPTDLTGSRLLSMSGSHREEGIIVVSGNFLSLNGMLNDKTAIEYPVCPEPRTSFYPTRQCCRANNSYSESA
jgi:predicted AlkP superfamily phosphohydrolase/phosphomutase